MSMMVSFVLSFFPRDVLDEILNLIESVSEDFPSYSFKENVIFPKARSCYIYALSYMSDVEILYKAIEFTFPMVFQTTANYKQ